MKFATCNCPVGMKYHALNCPTSPGKEQRVPAWALRQVKGKSAPDRLKRI